MVALWQISVSWRPEQKLQPELNDARGDRGGDNRTQTAAAWHAGLKPIVRIGVANTGELRVVEDVVKLGSELKALALANFGYFR
jgi:hypothetical protein